MDPFYEKVITITYTTSYLSHKTKKNEQERD